MTSQPDILPRQSYATSVDIKTDVIEPETCAGFPHCASPAKAIPNCHPWSDQIAVGMQDAQRQFDILRASGVKYVQGYLFGAPCPAAELDFKRFDRTRRLDYVA